MTQWWKLQEGLDDHLAETAKIPSKWCFVQRDHKQWRSQAPGYGGLGLGVKIDETDHVAELQHKMNSIRKKFQN